MKKGYIGIVFSFFQGMAIATMGIAIAKIGRYPPAMETGLFITGAAFIAIALIIFYKFRLGGNINPRVHPGVRALLTRYPALPVYFVMVFGIIVAALLFRSLGTV